MIGFIKSIGAAAVLAHPFLNLKKEEDLRRFLNEAENVEYKEIGGRDCPAAIVL